MDEVRFSYWCLELVEEVFTLQQIRAREWRGGKDWGEGRREKRVGREEVEKREKEKELEGGRKEEREGEWRNQGLGHTLQTLALDSYFPPLESSRTSPNSTTSWRQVSHMPHLTLWGTVCVQTIKSICADL